MSNITFTVGSTGFINYFPSSERTARNVAEAYRKNGENIAIIDGDDDWFASMLFHPYSLCDKWNIPILDNFHSGISGIAKSGIIISKSDLETFIKKFNAKKYQILRNFPQKKMWGIETIRIYDKEMNAWKILFEIDFNEEKKEALVKTINFRKLKKAKHLFYW